MSQSQSYELKPIGFVRSPLRERKGGPRQGYDGAPDAWIDVNEDVAEGLLDIEAGQEIVVITFLHQAVRDTLQVRPQYRKHLPPTGVFNTRSPDRPNPIGLHPVTVLEVDGNRLKVGPIEAIDGTPVVDIKPVLGRTADS